MSRLVRVLLLAAGAIVLALLVVRLGPAVILSLLQQIGWGFAIIPLLYAAHLAVR